MFKAVSCAIPGARSPSQAEENAGASDLPPLRKQIMRDVRRLYDDGIRERVHHYW